MWARGQKLFLTFKSHASLLDKPKIDYHSQIIVLVCIFIGLAVYGTRLPGFNTNHAIPFPENMWDFTNKFGPERFSRFDDYRTQTNRHPNRQEEYIYIDGRFSLFSTILGMRYSQAEELNSLLPSQPVDDGRLWEENLDCYSSKLGT